MIYKRFVKRPMDVILSLLAMIILSPIFLIIALLVRFKFGSPAIFKQKRPGLNEKIFTLYKFRTMMGEKTENGRLLPDSMRLTKFGKTLRSLSLDELPELFNILKGDMSIIGPRPLLVEYLPLYNSFQKRRHEVKPGLSGFAQVSGRNAISWEARFKLDVEYVDSVSFIGDWKIIFLTIKKVFEREGINSDTAATMEPMKGRLVIIGASGHGKVVADIAIKMNKWEKIVFLDDDESIKSAVGLQVAGSTKEILKYIHNSEVFVAIGNNSIREEILQYLLDKDVRTPVLVHPTAIIGSEVKIDKGTVVMAGTIINCCTKIGKGCIINTGAIIDHDNEIGDYVHISPGVKLAGAVKIEKRSWIGIGSNVINNINITGNCKIGAGAVVVSDITEPGTYVGAPAKKL